MFLLQTKLSNMPSSFHENEKRKSIIHNLCQIGRTPFIHPFSINSYTHIQDCHLHVTPSVVSRDINYE